MTWFLADLHWHRAPYCPCGRRATGRTVDVKIPPGKACPTLSQRAPRVEVRGALGAGEHGGDETELKPREDRLHDRAYGRKEMKT